MIIRLKMIWGIGLLLSLVLQTLPVMTGTTWQQIGGPTGGQVNSLAIDPINSQIIYVGTYGGGVFKSTDGGGSWSAIKKKT